jgi:tetratricopeptide (TPR) repeat protein
MTPRTNNCLITLIIALAAGAVSCSRSATSYVGRGNEDYAKGQYADASLNYRKALQKDPQSGEAYYRLALSEMKRGNIAVAYSSFSRAVQLSPENLSAVVSFADLVLYSYLNDPAHSKAQYELLTSFADRIAAKDPKSIDALRFKGFLAVTDRKPEEAIRLFQTANSIKPMQPEIVLPLAQTLVAVNQGAEAEKMAEECIGLHPHYIGLYNFLYYQYLNTNRREQAERILKAKIAAEPKEAAWYQELASHYARVGKTAEMNATLQHMLDNPKDFPQAHFRVGEFYAGIGNVDEALRQLNEGVNEDRSKAALYQKKIAQLLANQGKTTDALNVLETILKQHPDTPDAIALHALLLMDTGSVQKTDQAEKEVAAAIKAHPQDAGLHYALGRARYLKRDYGSARPELQKAISLDVGYVPPRVLLADLSLKTGRSSEALQYAEQALALEPDNVQAMLAHVTVLTALNRYVEARSELDRIIAQHPEQRDAQLQLGLLDVAQNRFKEADDIFGKMYKPGSGDNGPLQAIVRADVAAHKYDRSVQLLEEELKHASPGRSDELRNALAGIAMYAGKYDLALEQYKGLAEAHPEAPEFQRRIGILYNLKGDQPNALMALKKQAELSPNDAGAQADYGYVLEMTNRTAEAIQHYRKSLQLRPNNPVVSNNLAFLLADSDSSLSEAMILAKQAQQQKSGDPGVADTVAWIYYKQGLNESAIQIFRNLTTKYPEVAAFREHYAAVLIAKGQSAQAREQLQKALASNPSKPEEQRIRQLLRRLG